VNQPGNRRHWSDLDGLRAIAILLVLGRHSLRPFISEDTFQPIATLGWFDATAFLLNGWAGVDLFFVLSGFLIGRQALQGRDSWRRFWFKRATRILPAYWTCLAVVALTLTAFEAWNGRAAHFVAHIFMLQDYTGSVFVAAFWSLGAEEKFYLLTPLVALLLSRCPRAPGRVALLVLLWCLPIVARGIAAADEPFPMAYERYIPTFRWPFHFTYESLVVGFAIAWLTIEGRVRWLQQRLVREVVFWTGAVWVAWMLTGSLLFGHIEASTVIATPAMLGVGFGCLLLACVTGEGSYSRVLGHRLCRPLATGAYTLYLTHMMILPIASASGRSFPWLSANGLIADWLNFLPWYIGLSAVSAFLLHRWVERPVLVWRDQRLAQSRHVAQKPPFLANQGLIEPVGG
jgi:peptidoglycan/LPS O-acetylase OafA/YrhL